MVVGDFKLLADWMVHYICSVVFFPFGVLQYMSVTPVGTSAWFGRKKVVDGPGGGKGD